VTESGRAIDAPRRIRGEVVLGGEIGGQRVEVVTDHLGAGVLASGQPGQAGRMLKVQTMFDAFECFLDTPAAMIEIGEFCRRIARRVEQGGHKYAHFTLRRHLADQAHGGYLARALVIGGIPAIRRRQVHHGVVLARSHELGDGGKGRRRVATHAERHAAIEQGGHQPGARVTAIKDQHVVGAKSVEPLEQHLSLADQRAVQNQRIEQLDAGTKQAEQRRFADAAFALRVEQGQANLRRIGGQNPQSLPTRRFGKMLIDQAQQFVIEGIEYICPQMASRLREGAGRDLPTQAGSACQQGKERIEFSLHRPADSGEQKGDQVQKGQITLASEIP